MTIVSRNSFQGKDFIQSKQNRDQNMTAIVFI